MPFSIFKIFPVLCRVLKEKCDNALNIPKKKFGNNFDETFKNLICKNFKKLKKKSDAALKKFDAGSKYENIDIKNIILSITTYADVIFFRI